MLFKERPASSAARSSGISCWMHSHPLREMAVLALRRAVAKLGQRRRYCAWQFAGVEDHFGALPPVR